MGMFVEFEVCDEKQGKISISPIEVASIRQGKFLSENTTFLRLKGSSDIISVKGKICGSFGQD